MKKHNAIESPIFHAFRKREVKINKAIKLLKQNEYVIYKKPKK